MNTKITTVLNTNKTLSKSQIGFLPNHRTTEHIYTLQTLIWKHVHQSDKGKSFGCFVDFKKTFDSIWHKGLFLKMTESGIRGQVYEVIKNVWGK